MSGTNAGVAYIGIQFDGKDVARLSATSRKIGQSAAKNASGGWTRWGRTVSSATRYAKYGILGVAGAAALSIKSAGDFQQQINVLGAVSGATGDKLKKLQDEALKLGADTKLPATSARDAADAMTELSKAGLSVKDTMAAARPVLQLSAAAQISNADAATYTATALNQFGLAGTEAAHVADLLAGAANASAGDVPDMAEALQYAGAAAHAAGLSIDETVAAIAEMSNKGLAGSVAGSSLAQALRSLQAPSAKAAETMKELGLNIYDAKGRMLPMDGLIQQFGKHFDGLTQAQQNQKLATIFGSRAVQAARIVFLGGAKAYDKMKDSVSKAGSAQKLAEAQTKGFNGALQGFISNIETLGIKIGLKLLPVASEAVDALSGIVDTIGKIADAPSLNVAFNIVWRSAGKVYKSLDELLFGGFRQAADKSGRSGRGGHNIAPPVRFDGLAQKLRDAITDAFSKVDWESYGKKAGEGFQSGFETALNLQNIFDQIFGGNKGAEQAKRSGGQSANSFISGFFTGVDWGSLLKKIFNSNLNLPVLMHNMATTAWHLLSSDVTGLNWHDVWKPITRSLPSVKELRGKAFALAQAILLGFGNLPVAIGLLFARFGKAILSKLSGLVGSAKAKAASIGSSIKNGIISGLSGLADALTGAVKGAINAMIGAANSGINLVVDHWPDIPGAPGPPVGHSPIPTLARGAVINETTLAILGETGRARPEIVTPERLMRSTFEDVLRKSGYSASGDMPVIVNKIYIDGKEVRSIAREEVGRSNRSLAGSLAAGRRR